MDSERIIIIDGSGYIFRAFYAIQRLSTTQGFPTNAIFGFTNMLIRVLEVEKPTKLVIAFDTAKPTFRKEMYVEYKSNRVSPPDDLVKQIPFIFRAVDCFGIKRLDFGGYEADDIIGTVARRAEKEGYRVEIITGDKDLMQLVTDRIHLYDTMKDKRIDRAGVEERFGVSPEQIVDFLALMGDSSDNIPGVTGIGEKTAAELIRQFGSLDNLYERLEEIKQPKRRETLLQEKDTALLSRELARIQCDIPIDFKWEDLNYSGPNLEQLRAFFEELEFINLLKRFDLKTTEKTFEKGKFEIINTEKRLKEVVSQLSKATAVAVDTETTSLTVQQADLVGIALCGKAGESCYVPVGHCLLGDPQKPAEGQLGQDVVRALVKPLLENPYVKKVGQNLKYDIQVFRRWGVQVRGIASDTLVASYLINPEGSHSLDTLAFRYLGHQNITYEEVTGSGRAQINFAEVDIEKAAAYSSEDADVALRLHEKLIPELNKQGLTSLYESVEVPLVEVLAEMEYCGVKVNDQRLREMSQALQQALREVEEKVFDLSGEKFNINSPKQLSTILFEKLKLPILRRTKTGISTDEAVLQELSGEHEVCRWILKYRELTKLRSTYVEGLLEVISPATGRVHTNYNQTVTATGRLSSSNPNLQNIPVGADPRYDVRAAFVAPEGHWLLSVDYSQIELRLLAHMSGDRELLRAFSKDEDIHEYTARLVFGLKEDSPVNGDQRRVAKTINYGVTYGQTPYGLSQMLKISPKEAKLFIETYFARYSGIHRFLQSLIEQAKTKGYVTTLMGRRRYIPEINTSNKMRREMAERAAINAPIQGTAADLIKLAMVNLARRLGKENKKARMILQVHDELVLEVPEAEKQAVEKIVCEEMEGAMKFTVPLKVDVGWGRNWRECAEG